MTEMMIGGACNRAVQRRVPPRTTFSRRQKQLFLDTLAATCNAAASAEAAGVVVSTCYRHRKRDEGFAAAWREALAIGYERLETALLEYALARVASHEADPDNADQDAVAEGLIARIENKAVSVGELQFALSLLSRHGASINGRAAARRGSKRATAEETDAALTRRLDALAQQMAQHGR